MQWKLFKSPQAIFSKCTIIQIFIFLITASQNKTKMYKAHPQLQKKKKSGIFSLYYYLYNAFYHVSLEWVFFIVLQKPFTNTPRFWGRIKTFTYLLQLLSVLAAITTLGWTAI